MEKKYIVLDTETTNSLDDPIAYDIGFAVIDEYGTVYETYSYVIADVFLDKDLMASAYFADKIPQYWEDIKKGTRKLVKLNTARMILKKVMERYNTNIVIAHNARFDYRSLSTTQRFLTDNIDFIESHTGLEDVLIEKEIFVFCMKCGVNDGRLWK